MRRKTKFKCARCTNFDNYDFHLETNIFWLFDMSYYMCHILNMEQSIPYSLICNLFSRYLETNLKYMILLYDTDARMV